MKSPRIKLLKTVNGFKVYEVNGELIRKNLDTQFTNFGQHYRFPKIIPMKELWIDKEASGDKEYKYFIPHLQKEWELMNKGFKYDTAISEADDLEHGLRNKDEHNQYKIKKLGEINGVSVWLVNGEKVRSDCYIDFTEGGHDLVYDWIPKSEIWLDNAVQDKERIYILAHEYDERVKMSDGEKYGKAHNQASFFERRLRHQYPKLGKYPVSKNKKNVIMETLGRIKG